MKALVLSLAPLSERASFRDVDVLLEAGWDVTLMVTSLPLSVDAPPGVALLQMRDAEQTSVLWRLERALVVTLPTRVLRLVRGVFVRLGGLRGIGRPSRSAARAVMRLQHRQARLSRLAHRRWSIGPYKALRPFLLWRWARPLVLPELQQAGRDLIVCTDRESTALAWHLARRLPHTPVRFRVDTHSVSAIAPANLAVPA